MAMNEDPRNSTFVADLEMEQQESQQSQQQQQEPYHLRNHNENPTSSVLDHHHHHDHHLHEEEDAEEEEAAEEEKGPVQIFYETHGKHKQLLLCICMGLKGFDDQPVEECDFQEYPYPQYFVVCCHRTKRYHQPTRDQLIQEVRRRQIPVKGLQNKKVDDLCQQLRAHPITHPYDIDYFQQQAKEFATVIKDCIRHNTPSAQEVPPPPNLIQPYDLWKPLQGAIRSLLKKKMIQLKTAERVCQAYGKLLYKYAHNVIQPNATDQALDASARVSTLYIRHRENVQRLHQEIVGLESRLQQEEEEEGPSPLAPPPFWTGLQQANQLM